MTRTSTDEIRDGFVYNGYDYALQVWVVDGIVQPCGHPDGMRSDGTDCCNQYLYQSQSLASIPGAQDRREG